MADHKTLFERWMAAADKKRKPTYRINEIIYYLEVLPINRISAMLAKKEDEQR